MKNLEVEPYSLEDSLRAAGQGSFVQPQKRKMETQPSKQEYAAGKRVKVDVVIEEDKPAKQYLSKVPKYEGQFARILEDLKKPAE